MIRVENHNGVQRIDLARTLLGRGWYRTTAYLAGQTLIDSGPAHTCSELLNYLQDFPIRQIINTHAHEDHIGTNGPLQKQRPDIRIYAHPDALPTLANPTTEQPLQFYRQLIWGWPEPSEAIPVVDGELIHDGEHQFQVIHTPGHTNHHICLYEPERGWLFSGDLFVGGHDRAIGAGNDVWQIVTSLKRVAALPLATLFPGAARIRNHPQRALNRKIQMLEELGERILQLHQAGWQEGRIVHELLGGPMFIELFTGGHFSRLHLVRSFLNVPSNQTEGGTSNAR